VRACHVVQKVDVMVTQGQIVAAHYVAQEMGG